MPDIDLDFPDRTKILELIKHVPATIIVDGQHKKHNTGVYCHEIPVNPLTGTASIDYKEADNRGYFKIDFLNVSIYKDVRDPAHLDQLINQEPIWDLLLQDDFVNLLFHLNGYGDVLRKMKPRSLDQLAAVLAMIRPAKKHLIGQDWITVMEEVWQKPNNDEYYFKKSHSLSYALAVVVHMNLLCEKFTSQGVS